MKNSLFYIFVNAVRRTVLIALLLLGSCIARAQLTETEMLGRAIEYFGSQKYQEALITFNQLEQTRRLSARMLAYKGVCYYRLEMYADAITTLSQVASSMSSYSPHEQAVYYYAWGESHFQLGHYFECIPCLKEAIGVCPMSDKAEIFYRLGFASTMISEYEDAIEYFSSADSLYEKCVMGRTEKAHREQGRRMLHHLLITHGPRRVDVADKEARQDEDDGTHNDDADVDKSPEH